MTKFHQIFIVFAIGIIVGVLATTFITLGYNTAFADATSGSASHIIAVTGLCANGISGLWVLDASDTNTSPTLCLYMPEGSGRNGIKLTGARRIKYDFKLIEYKDNSERDYKVLTLKKDVEEMNRKAEEKATKDRK